MKSLLQKIGKSSKYQKCKSCHSSYEVVYLPFISGGIARRVPYLRCKGCHRYKVLNSVMWVIQEHPHIKDLDITSRQRGERLDNYI